MQYDREDLFVDGTFAPAGSSERIEAINPTDESRIGHVADSNAQDVDAAVRAARRAFRESGWPQLQPAERAAYLYALADQLAARQDEIGALVTTQNGMVLKTSVASNGSGAAARYRYFAALAESAEREEIRPILSPAGAATGDSTIVRQEPIGVVGVIVAWNVPQGLIASKLGAALAAGCTAVVKPSPETSLDCVILAEAVMAAGIPAGVVNIVTGGRETGMALVDHPDVDKIAFTGSTSAGRQIAASCGAALKAVTLELGGKSAAIILEDADLDFYGRSLATSSLQYSGQACRASTRILAPRSRYSEVVAATVDSLKDQVIGDPTDPDTVFGPLVSARQRERVEGYVEVGVAEGGILALGGRRPKGFERGYYFEPTVFAEVRNDMRIAREEIFGPVLVVIPYGSEDEAIQIANDSEYGLGGSVFTGDPEQGLDLARRVETGSISVNYSGGLPLNSPFGGVKNSGIGRELGPEGLESYQVTKSIHRKG